MGAAEVFSESVEAFDEHSRTSQEEGDSPCRRNWLRRARRLNAPRIPVAKNAKNMKKLPRAHMKMFVNIVTNRVNE